jgi:hypothetical protein
MRDHVGGHDAELSKERGSVLAVVVDGEPVRAAEIR